LTATRHGAVLRVGLISDTHGLLRPEAVTFLLGSDHIVHAGDVGDPRILEALLDLAPVTTVRGNVDRGDWAEGLPEAVTVRLGGLSVHVLHDLAQLALDPRTAGFDVVVFGHSHRSLVQRRGRILYVNPGSAGPRRFRLPITAAELVVTGTTISPRIVEIVRP
jgi:putative phosphoesterase